MIQQKRLHRSPAKVKFTALQMLELLCDPGHVFPLPRHGLFIYSEIQRERSIRELFLFSWMVRNGMSLGVFQASGDCRGMFNLEKEVRELWLFNKCTINIALLPISWKICVEL